MRAPVDHIAAPEFPVRLPWINTPALRMKELQGRPVLLAVSRKDFVGALTGRPPRERLAGTLAAVGFGVDAGAHLLRVHDVRAVSDYLTVRAALRGDEEVPADLRLPDELRRES